MIRSPRIRENYQRRLDIAFILSLLFVLTAVRWAARTEVYPRSPEVEIPVFTVENVPVTKQGKKRPLPPRPTIPVPAAEDEIPDAETIEPIDFKYYSDLSADGGAGRQEVSVGGPNIIPPRPIAWVIPEYPEEERKKGVKGEITLSLEIDETGKVLRAVVIENQTGSKLCAQAAVRAALASRFIPAMKNGKPTKYWHVQPYRFDITQ